MPKGPEAASSAKGEAENGILRGGKYRSGIGISLRPWRKFHYTYDRLGGPEAREVPEYLPKERGESPGAACPFGLETAPHASREEIMIPGGFRLHPEPEAAFRGGVGEHRR